MKHDSKIKISRQIDKFSPLSLDELNNKAEMMSRKDNKYIIRSKTLLKALPKLRDAFDVLEINQRRVFSYETSYFDDHDLRAYYEHHNGFRKRFKARTRRYVDAGLCFLEIKLKGGRGTTIKQRISINEQDMSQLSLGQGAFLSTAYSEHYGHEFDYDVQKKLDIYYNRMTLVAKSGGERMTIDTDLQFHNQGNSLQIASNLYVIEAKSISGRGVGDKIMRGLNQRPTVRCSKYCIAMASLGMVPRYNRFLPAMKEFNLAKFGRTIPDPE